MAATTTTATTNNYQAVRTDNDTRTTPEGGKPNPRFFHLINAETPENIHTICGTTIPKRIMVRTSSTIAEQRGRVECPDCRMLYNLNVELKAALRGGGL